MCPQCNEQLLQTAPLSEAAGSLRSPAALFMMAPLQNCGRYADGSCFGVISRQQVNCYSSLARPPAQGRGAQLTRKRLRAHNTSAILPNHVLETS